MFRDSDTYDFHERYITPGLFAVKHPNFREACSKTANNADEERELRADGFYTRGYF